MSKTLRDIDYWGTGFKVRLLNVPCYKDEGEFFPDIPLIDLQYLVARKVILNQYLITGNEVSLLRAVADLTRSEAARKLGKTRRTLINWEEQGDKPISADPLIHLSLRLLFYSWIFPGAALPKQILHLNRTDVKSPINLDFSDYKIIGRKIRNLPAETQLNKGSRSAKAHGRMRLAK